MIARVCRTNAPAVGRFDGGECRAMWCQHCRQDVPGIKSPERREVSCSRCGSALVPGSSTATDAPKSAGRSAAPLSPLSSFPSFEDWSIDQSFHDLQARVGAHHRATTAAAPQPGTAAPASTASRQPRRRIDSAHSIPSRHRRPVRHATPKVSWLARFVTWLGLLGFAGGAVFLIWSVLEQREDFWRYGVPMTVAGLVWLLLGFVMHLERIWQNGRDAVAKLNRVDSQLDVLRRSNAMLSTTQSTAAQAFYTHMADDAHPQILLADLKGQLDLLAMSMSKRRA